MDLNKAMIIGRLTRDPEARTTPSGQQVTTFSVATNFRWKDKTGTQKDIAEYHNIVTWNKLAEICAQYLKKGTQVYIEGRLQTRSWEGKDNVKRYTTEIIASDMMMLGSKPQGASSTPSAPSTSTSSPAPKSKDAVKDSSKEKVEEKNKDDDDEIRIEDIPF